MYSAAVAAGMTATFGAPFGALLFSIEVSSTYYMVSNLFKGFFCACFALIIFKITSIIPWLHMFIPTRFPLSIKIDHELLLFGLLGILSGLFAAVFVKIMTNIIYARHKLNIPVISDRVKWCLGVALISALMKFPVPFLMISDYKILNQMFTINDLSQNEGNFKLISFFRRVPLEPPINRFQLVNLCDPKIHPDHACSQFSNSSWYPHTIIYHWGRLWKALWPHS